jgi:cytidylate kinase
MRMFSERTQVLLSPKQVEKLKRLAARDGRSVGAVIRAAVDRFEDPGDDTRRRAFEDMLAIDAPVDDWEIMKAQIRTSQLGGEW